MNWTGHPVLASLTSGRSTSWMMERWSTSGEMGKGCQRKAMTCNESEWGWVSKESVKAWLRARMTNRPTVKWISRVDEYCEERVGRWWTECSERKCQNRASEILIDTQIKHNFVLLCLCSDCIWQWWLHYVMFPLMYFYRDKTEELKELTEEQRRDLAVSENQRLNREFQYCPSSSFTPSTYSSNPRSREKGLKIYLNHDDWKEQIVKLVGRNRGLAGH